MPRDYGLVLVPPGANVADIVPKLIARWGNREDTPIAPYKRRYSRAIVAMWLADTPTPSLEEIARTLPAQDDMPTPGFIEDGRICVMDDHAKWTDWGYEEEPPNPIPDMIMTPEGAWHDFNTALADAEDRLEAWAQWHTQATALLAQFANCQRVAIWFA